MCSLVYTVYGPDKHHSIFNLKQNRWACLSVPRRTGAVSAGEMLQGKSCQLSNFSSVKIKVKRAARDKVSSSAESDCAAADLGHCYMPHLKIKD